MSSEAPLESPLSITCTPMRGGQVFVVALCKRCKLVRERFIPNREDIESLAHLVGTDALSKAGCPHTAAIDRSGRWLAYDAGDLPIKSRTPAAPWLPEPTSRKRERMPSAMEELPRSRRDPRGDE